MDIKPTKIAIGFVRFESLRPGFVDSRFESKGMDSWIPKFTLKGTKYEDIPSNFPNKRTFIFLHANLKLLGLGQFFDIIVWNVWYFYNLLNGIYTLKTGIRIRVRIRILGQIRIRDSNPRKNESLTSLIGRQLLCRPFCLVPLVFSFDKTLVAKYTNHSFKNS